MAKSSEGKGKRRSRGSGGDGLPALVPGGPAPAAAMQRALRRLTGARACYGKPIEAHGHVVIPVATLRTFGGLGFGRGTAADDLAAPSAGAGEHPVRGGDPLANSGGGGGGLVDARPIGFIDIGPDGARFEPIEVASPPRRASTTLLVALGIVAASRLLGRRVGARAGSRPAWGLLLRQRRATAVPWPGRSLRR